MHKFEGKLVDLKVAVWNDGIFVPNIIVEEYLTINDKRIICTLNEEIHHHTALLPKGDNNWFFNVNKEIQKKLKIKKNDIVTVKIETDWSQYGMETPEEFIECLQQDLLAKEYFEALTIGKRRALLQLVLKIKSSQKRIEKSIVILEYLTKVDGHLDFKELHLALKNSRY